MAILEIKDVYFSYTSDAVLRTGSASGYESPHSSGAEAFAKNETGYFAKNGAKYVLRGVNCVFERGAFYAVIGKSGSGKSTLLNLIAGLDQPAEGVLLFEGKPLSEINQDEYRRKSVAVIYQDFSLFPLLTALENILYPMELCRVEKTQARADALKLAEMVSLPENLLDRYPNKISGGEQQRVAIARALAMDRRLILADEPTGNLDSETSATIIALLKLLAKEQDRCVIVATHDISVMKVADAVYHIVDGRLQKTEKQYPE